MDVQAHKLLRIEKGADFIVLAVECEQVDSKLLSRIEREVTVLGARGVKLPVILQMDRIEVVSSVMMGALLALLRKLKHRGLRLILVGLNEHIRGTFKLTQLDRMFEILDTVEDAHRVMRKHNRL